MAISSLVERANKIDPRLKSVCWVREQVAQLSQRDRTVGWASFGQTWKTETGRQYFADIRSVFNHCDVNGQQSGSRAIEFGEKRIIRAITAFKVIQGHRGRYQSKARMRFAISD